MNPSTPRTAIAAIFLTLSAAAATAQNQIQEETLITATRTPIPVSESLHPISTLDREDIERIGSVDLAALLESLPGFDLARSGGVGSQTSLWLRGSESDHVLLLVDGVRMESAQTGIPPWHAIPLAQVERIEVVRGPRSSLYGSEALGGIIHIFTRRASGKRLHAALGLGSRQRREQSASVSTGDENLWLNFSAQHETTEGIDNIQSACPDRDAWRSSNAKLGVGGQMPEGEWRLDYTRVESANEFDNVFGDCAAHQKSRWDIAALSWNQRLSETWETRVVAGSHRQRDRNYSNGASFFATERLSLSWQNDLRLGAGTLLSLGADYRDDEIDNTTEYTERERDNGGIFAQVQHRADGWSLAAAWRMDDNEQYGSHETGSIDLGVELPGAHRLTLSVGEGFRAPSFGNLYFPGFGNPDLEPEESRNHELGLRGGGDELSWQLFIYDNRIKNLINYSPALMRSENLGKVDIRGVEWIFNARRGAWRSELSLNWLDAKDADTGLALLRRAKRRVQLRVDYQGRRWSIGGDWLWRGTREDTNFNVFPFSRVELGGYSVFNARLTRQLAPDWRLELKLDNMFNKKYQHIFDYGTEGFGARASLRWDSP